MVLTPNLVFCFGPKLWFWPKPNLNNILMIHRYNGITYTKCTAQDSPTSQPWCATQVYTKSREAVDYKDGVGVCQDWCDVHLSVADVVEPRNL